MTVDELNDVWLHRNRPLSVIKIWSIKEVDYIYSSDDNKKYDKAYHDIKDLRVECFTTYYSEEKDKNYLVINVE